ncbi:hypothetical protein, partial [Aeromonas caviae]|uniref:hypothetical protein n=1 Tax=Aeromonas caviae TaxID=648 RepID=UPI001CC47186
STQSFGCGLFCLATNQIAQTGLSSLPPVIYYSEQLFSKVGYQKRAESKINKLEDDIAALKMENRLLRSLLQKYETDDELQLDKLPKPPEGN